MQTKQKDILTTQLNTEETHNKDSGNEQLFKIKPIQNTPFHILNKENEYYLTIGNNLLTVGMETEEKILKYLEEHKWDIITTIIIIITDKQINDKTIQRPKDITAIA